MNNNIKIIIKERNINKLRELLYFKLHKKEYNYVSYNRKTDSIEKGIKDNVKIAVYSCILGNYDKIREPIYINENIDYYMFTDQTVDFSSTSWKIIDINDVPIEGSNIFKNRYIKFHPNIFFQDYDFSVYIDGNVSVLSGIEDICKSIKKSNKFIGLHRHNQRDCIYVEARALEHLSRFKPIINLIKKQVESYRQNGFPENYGLYENTIIIREHNNSKCIELMDKWWDEYKKYPTRDQLSLPYVINQNNAEKYIFILGNDLKRNEYFRYYLHN